MLFSQGLQGRSRSGLAALLGRGSGSGAFCPGALEDRGVTCLLLNPACICCPRQNNGDDAWVSLTEKTPLPDPESRLCFLAVHFSALCWGKVLKE